MLTDKSGIHPIPLGYVDGDPQRTRLFNDIVTQLNRTAGVVVTVTAPDTPNQEFGVLHPHLQKKIDEFEVLSTDNEGQLYRSSPHRWTKRVSFFKYSGRGGRIKIRLR